MSCDAFLRWYGSHCKPVKARAASNRPPSEIQERPRSRSKWQSNSRRFGSRDRDSGEIARNRDVPQKRARLSQSEEDEEEAGHSSKNRLMGITTKGNEDGSEHGTDVKPSLRTRRVGAASEGIHLAGSERETPDELDLSSSNHPLARSPVTRSHSPRPSLRNRHRRASSFHSSSIVTDRERRFRRRFGSQEEENAAQSPREYKHTPQ